jgi:hypothetical protein
MFEKNRLPCNSNSSNRITKSKEQSKKTKVGLGRVIDFSSIEEEKYRQ